MTEQHCQNTHMYCQPICCQPLGWLPEEYNSAFSFLIQTLIELIRLGKSSTEQVIRRFLCDLVQQQVSLLVYFPSTFLLVFA